METKKNIKGERGLPGRNPGGRIVTIIGERSVDYGVSKAFLAST